MNKFNASPPGYHPGRRWRNNAKEGIEIESELHFVMNEL